MLPQSLTYSAKKRLEFIKAAASFLFVLGMLMSKNLWIQNRNFPTIPVFENFVKLPLYLDSPLFYSMIVLLLVSTFLESRFYLITFFGILSLLLFQDQMRWHPWVYMYVLVLVPFLMKIKKNDYENVLNYLQILFIGIYLWSGVHKFNANFNDLIVEGFAKYLFEISDGEALATFKSFGYLFPSMEIFAAILLLFPRTRKIGLFAVIFMHLFIIIYVSPLGMNYNYIILPWNVFMIIAGSLLYYNSKRVLLFSGRTFVRKCLTTFTFFVLALPSLNFIDYWDSYLSFSLFSGKIDNYYILSKDSILSDQTSYDIKDYYIAPATGHQNGEILYIDTWANSVLNVPMYPEERLFKKIAKSFCTENNNSSDFIFLTTNVPLWHLYKSKETSSIKNTENYTDQILFFKFKKEIENNSFKYFVCDDLK